MSPKSPKILLGRSTSGKSTTKCKLKTYGYKFIVPQTTRAPRDGELEGVDYEFVKSIYFPENCNDDLFYTEKPGDNSYGYDMKGLRNDKFVCTTGMGVGEEVLRNKYLFPNLIAVLLEIDDETFFQRLRERGATEEDIAIREKTSHISNQLRNMIDITLSGSDDLDSNIRKIANLTKK